MHHTPRSRAMLSCPSPKLRIQTEAGTPPPACPHPHQLLCFRSDLSAQGHLPQKVPSRPTSGQCCNQLARLSQQWHLCLATSDSVPYALNCIISQAKLISLDHVLLHETQGNIKLSMHTTPAPKNINDKNVNRCSTIPL